ncbi:MAG: hypothetical protein JJT95_01190 [Pararhodobacter sp.]|nr:hypothetical protein [Pararhodobacter sp.]
MPAPFAASPNLRASPALALALLLFAAAGVSADTPTSNAAEKLAHIEALIAEGNAQQAMAEARTLYLDLAARAGFAIGEAVLTTEPATGYGVYEPRRDNVFDPDEPMHVYVELTGARITERSGGVNEMLFEVEFAVLDSQGTQLTDVISMGEVSLLSRARGVDLFLELTYNLTSAPAGEYVLWTEITDAASRQSVTFDLPVAIGGN